MQQNTTEIFRDAPVPKAVLSNVIPSIISMIMVLIYNLADTFFIGQTKNALMVAAVSVATPAFLLFMASVCYSVSAERPLSPVCLEKVRKNAPNMPPHSASGPGWLWESYL